MTIRSVFLFAPAETASADKGAPAYAISLARAHGAALTVFVVALDVTTPGRQTDAPGLANGIASAAAAAGVRCHLITEHSHAIGVHEAVAAYARLHDITVIGADGSGLLSERLVAEYLLFDSGRPIMLVPRGFEGGYVSGSAAVAWDGTAPAARALGDCLALLDPATLVLLAVEGEKTLHLDPGMDEVAATLRQRNIDVRYVRPHLANRTIANALQDEAEASDAPILVMGAFARSRLRSMVWGGATSGIMANVRIPVLLSH